MCSHAGLKLLDEQRNPLSATLSVPDRIIHLDARGGRAVLEEDLHGIADLAFLGVVVFLREGRVFDDLHQ